MISRIKAYNYRCFKHLDIKLDRYHVLAGSNGSGKSTLLDIPLLLGDMLTRGVNEAFLEVPAIGDSPRAQTLQELVYCDLGDTFGFEIEAEIPTDIQLYGISSYLRTVRYNIEFKIVDRLLLTVAEEEFWFLDYGTASTLNRTANKESGNNGSYWRQVFFRLRDSNGKMDEVWFPNLPPQLLPKNVLILSASFLPSSYMPLILWLQNLLKTGTVNYLPNWTMLRKACPPGQKKTIRADAANLPWLVLELSKNNPELLQDWIDHVKIGLPNLDNIVAVEREEDRHAYLKLTYSGGYVVTSSGLSYGTLYILAFTILPYLRNLPSLIFIEEPENGIHPKAIEVVLQSLSSLYDAQTMITTHSPIVLAHTDLDSIIVMQTSKENGSTAILGTDHPRLQTWQGAIDLGSLFAAGVLG